MACGCVNWLTYKPVNRLIFRLTPNTEHRRPIHSKDSSLPRCDITACATEQRWRQYEKAIHIPVLLDEILQYLRIKEDGIYVDCTVGEGGHAEAILEHINKKGLLIGLDKDEKALRRAEERLKIVAENFCLLKSDFVHLPSQLERIGIHQVDGVVLDLGLSSFQLEEASRGFSFRKNGPLDMRFDTSSPVRAEELVNELPYSELERILRNFGEERKASLIARRIVQRRKEKRIRTTFELAEIARKALRRTGRIDPATRTFQAFRIATNRELESLQKVLPEAPSLLKPGGRVCVISYHSLEDRIVKRSFKEAEGRGILKIITRKPVSPSIPEIQRNPHSRSAKLRAGEGVKG